MPRTAKAADLIFIGPDEEYLTLAEAKQRVESDPRHADQLRIYGGQTYRQFVEAGGVTQAVSDWWFDEESEVWSLAAVRECVRKDPAAAGSFHDAAGRSFRDFIAAEQ